MPLYNTAVYVGPAIESILAQTVRDFELLVVDDGSTDGGPDLVRAFADGRIRLLSGHPNGGPGAARNRGLSAARGRRIAFFDSDDLAAPAMLATLMECMDTEPGCEIASGWYEGIDEAGQLNGRDFKPVISPDKLAPSMLFSNCIPTSVLLLKRECLEGQTFDEHLEPVSDYDMWARLLIAHKAKQLPRVLARYRSRPASISHQKSAAAAECLRRIYCRQLARLGIEATAAEIDLHARLTTLTFGTPKETVLAAETWLLKLDAANARTRLYPTQPFREILGDRWYAVCHSAGGNGFWTWRQYFGSPLSKWIFPTTSQRYHLLRLSARGAIKSLMKF